MLKTNIKLSISFKKILLIWLVILVSFGILSASFNSYDEKSRQVQKIVVGVVNNDPSAPTLMLLDSFKNTEHFSDLFELTTLNITEAKTKFSAGDIDAYIIIPKDFAEALFYYENKKIIVYTRVGNRTKNSILLNTLRGYSDYVKTTDVATYTLNNLMKDLKVGNKKFKEINNKFTFELLTATIGRTIYFNREKINDIPKSSSLIYYLFSIPISIVTFISISYALSYLSKREKSVYKRIIMSDISLIKNNVVELLSLMISSLILFSPYYIFLLFYKNLMVFVTSIISITLIYVLWAYLWTIIATILKDKLLTSFTSILGAFFITFLSGGIIPFILLPTWVKNASVYIPNLNAIKLMLGAQNYNDIIYIVAITITLFFIKYALERKAEGAA